MAGVPRWPELDGLRAVAVAAVVLFHAGLGPGVNGFVGVDVFFALSGFLITALLLRERERSGTIWLRGFYLRRMLRLYPALVTLCAGVMLIGIISGEFGVVARAAVAALVYLANWWIYTGHPAPLLEHTWTLAIEEHFYLLWPPVLAGLCSPRRVPRVLALLFAGVVVAALALPWPQPLAAVPLSYVRGTPLIWGCLLAWLWANGRGRTAGARVWRPLGWVALTALVAICVIPWRLDHRWLEGYSSVPGMLAVVVLAATVLGAGGPAVLGWGPLRWLGERSYGVYLYHFPVLSLLWHHLPAPFGPVVQRLLAILVTLVVAEASYRVVESPALALKGRIHRIPPGTS